MANKMAARVINLQTRIAELWQFKAQKIEKVKKDDCLAIVYGKGVFLDAAKNGMVFSSY